MRRHQSPSPSQGTSAEVPPAEAVSLTESFMGIARRLRTSSAESLARYDITPAQARALMVLGRHQPRRPGDLAERLRIAARSATEVIDALEQRALVRRSPDPSDRRATLVELTEPGLDLVHVLRAARESEADAYFDRLCGDDRDELARILGLLSDD